MTRLVYEDKFVSESVRYYASSGMLPRARLGSREYARARSAIPTWCLDGLVCGTTELGKHAVVLIVRSDKDEACGPFRNETWVIGGVWDMVTEWKEFVRLKVKGELFSGNGERGLVVDGPIGPQLFATGWGPNTDGAFGYQGVTLQYCYRVLLTTTIRPEDFRPDSDHGQVKIITSWESCHNFHPYIRDVIELSGWLKDT